MMRQVAIVGALPGELMPLVRRWRRLPDEGRCLAWRVESDRLSCVAVCAGMGSAPATRAFARAMREIEPAEVWSVGWAGALRHGLSAGSVVRSGQAIDAQTGERLGGDSGASRILTLGYVADRREKERLRSSYPEAAAVDMEAATVARLSQAHGLRFRAFKAISDEADANLPDLNRYIGSDGQFRIAGFVAYSLMRPRYWGALAQFGRHARLAADRLADAVRQELEAQEG